MKVGDLITALQERDPEDELEISYQDWEQEEQCELYVYRVFPPDPPGSHLGVTVIYAGAYETEDERPER